MINRDLEPCLQQLKLHFYPFYVTRLIMTSKRTIISCNAGGCVFFDNAGNKIWVVFPYFVIYLSPSNEFYNFLNQMHVFFFLFVKNLQRGVPETLAVQLFQSVIIDKKIKTMTLQQQYLLETKVLQKVLAEMILVQNPELQS